MHALTTSCTYLQHNLSATQKFGNWSMKLDYIYCIYDGVWVHMYFCLSTTQSHINTHGVTTLYVHLHQLTLTRSCMHANPYKIMNLQHFANTYIITQARFIYTIIMLIHHCTCIYIIINAFTPSYMHLCHYNCTYTSCMLLQHRTCTFTSCALWHTTHAFSTWYMHYHHHICSDQPCMHFQPHICIFSIAHLLWTLYLHLPPHINQTLIGKCFINNKVKK